eukprot:Skav202804  [mRNA]  locus=scaffold326:887920:888702:- [translate_table: standard]
MVGTSRSDKSVKPIHPLAAGPKQVKEHTKKHDALNEPLEDSWALYRLRNGLQNPNAGQGNSTAAASQTPQAAFAVQAVEAPIAARFAAIEKRLAANEEGFDKLSAGQSTLVQQMEKTGHQLHHVEQQIHGVHTQIQDGIEKAFAHNMQKQNERLDSKFAQLVKLLKAPPPKRALPEDEDHEMSPIKPGIAQSSS